MESGSWSTPMAPVITGLGVGTKTCEVDNVFPPNDLWFGLDTYTGCASFI